MGGTHVQVLKNREKLEKLGNEIDNINAHSEKKLAENLSSTLREQGAEFIKKSNSVYEKASLSLLEKHKHFRQTKDGLQIQNKFQTAQDFEEAVSKLNLVELDHLSAPKAPPGISYKLICK